MRNKTRTVLFLVAGLILLAGMLATMAATREGVRKTDGANQDATPRLSPFINIWLETNVDNLEPAIAYNNLHDEYLVVWSNTRGGGATRDIYARRVRGDGTLLSNFTIAHNANFHNYEPDVAYSPVHDEYLIVYTYDSAITDSDIWARRVNWNGSWMSSEFEIGRKPDKQHHPAVAYNSDADEYLVVYQNTWGGGGQDIDAQRVRASDGWSPGWVNVVAGAGFRSFPDVVHNAASNYYLIAYTFQPSALGSGDIYGKVASWNFGHLSSEHHICDDANNQGFVAVAASAEEYLAVWEDSPSGSTTELYARRLAADGTPQGPAGGFWITGSPGRYDTAPAVAYGRGYGYLITWDRFMGGPDYNVYGRYAMPGWDNAAGPEFALDNDVDAQMQPAVACATNGDCLMAEEDNNSVGGDFEIRGRLAMPYHLYLPLVLRNY
ncbi:MAG: hypothetical protein KJ638_07570 [Chloroflexi bacterium]|nr:hypothetical protein [Chloroflexota bacterium]MBU1748876.1 hypothetical protein [Chloroflexota bacterium]